MNVGTTFTKKASLSVLGLASIGGTNASGREEESSVIAESLLFAHILTLLFASANQ
jgi:hypothetical protein